MEKHMVPLIIRGRVITDNLRTFEGRRGSVSFESPDVNAYFDDIVMRNPSEMKDLYDISLEEIYDYLVELGARLSVETNPHMRKAFEISIAVSGMGRDILYSMYENMRLALNRDYLREAVETNIGSGYLEGWVKTQLNDRTTEIRAMGARSVHINAGNGVAVAMMSIMTNSLLRSDAIIKSPSNDPFTAVGLALTMIDMAPDHPLTKHFSVCYWKGGDTEFEKRLYRPTNIEKIVAWGGFASMQHIRAHLGPGMDLIALDPKLSGSLIGKEALESEETMAFVAGQLAKDVGYFNQEGCVSSRTAYVESGTDTSGITRINRFGQMVFDKIQQLPKELSGLHPSFDPVLRDEISGIRHNNFYNIIGGHGNEGAVIVSQENEPVDFADQLGCRVVNLVPVDSIEEALKRITVHTQTLGVYPEALKLKVRDDCGRRGAQRLTSLGCATSVGISQPQDAIEQMRRMLRWIVVENFSEDTIKGHGTGFVLGT